MEDLTHFKEKRWNHLREFDRIFITALLTKHKGIITHAAKEAGIHERHLNYLIQRAGINKSEFRGKSEAK